MEREIRGLLDYLKASPTAYHAVEASAALLRGFQELRESEAWMLIPGGRYYVTRNRSAIIAFVMPEGRPESFQITASHTDSPTFRIKANAELETRGKYTRLDVEPYGGAIDSTWLDRPLSVAGRVMVRTSCGISTRLIHIDRDLLVIPNVAIHMNREVNNGYKWNPAVDLMPLYGSGDAAGTFSALIAEAAGCTPEEIMGTDLYLCSRTPGTVWGMNGEYVSAGRLDDLECAYAAIRAVSDSGAAGHVNMACLFDNEEVGNNTRQGADSEFMSEVMRRIMAACGCGEEDLSRALASSFMLSADNAHATHPNHPEYADPVNQVWMNEGIVLKFNARQRYATDGAAQAILTAVCSRAGVPVQFFANRSDLPGGTTLGSTSIRHVGISTADIGLAQLAMHSAWETAGTKDLDYMIRAMKAFYAAEIRMKGDGDYVMDGSVTE